MSDRRFRGIEFDSKLERDHYLILLDDEDVEVLERQKTFLLFDRFSYTRLPSMKKGYIRKMEYTPDFIIAVKGLDKPIALESKGFSRKDYQIKKKLFIRIYSDRYYFMESKGYDLIKQLEELKKKVKTC